MSIGERAENVEEGLTWRQVLIKAFSMRACRVLNIKH